MKYVPLNIKTENSLLSSLIKIDDLISYAKENHLSALTITDKNMFGAFEFYKKCTENNIKPIIGLEVEYNNYTFVLYAKNYKGYQNLCKIETIITEKEITKEELKCYSSNLISMQPYPKNSDLTFYEDIFYTYKNDEEKSLIKEENKMYMNAIYAIKKEDTIYLKYLKAIKEGKLVKEIEDDFSLNYLKIEKDSEKLFSLVDIKIEKQEDLLPKYSSEDADKVLRKHCKEGLKKRFGERVPSIYLERLEYELDVISKMGFSNYFLIVSDYVNYAKENGILVGAGRGSAASSLVSYVLSITNIDPLKHQLLFERFLNPERITMPDIDVDFLDSRREEVIAYCVNKYGKKRTAGIITFGTLSSKQVIRDTFRSLDLDSNVLSKLLDSNLTLEENKKNKKVFDYLKENEKESKAYLIAQKLEGLKRHTSIHAAGIVMSSKDLDEILPLYYHNGMYLTCYSMNYLEDLGLLKMDFLGLKNLNIIDRTLKELKKDNINLNLDTIPLNDKETLDIFNKVNTIGIFQFESEGMMSFLKKLKPITFPDIYAALALYRPGPMGNIDHYIKRREGKEKIPTYKGLESILESTYGILIYQEQIMQVANIMASYSLGRSDILRRAMSKKKEDVLLKEKDYFITSSIANGYTRKESEEVFNFILKFASYGFNKAHSVAYATISYQMAYLKAHYKTYFLKTLLDMSLGSVDAITSYIKEAKKNGIDILKVDINKSSDVYVKEKDNLRIPLTAIKNIGTNFAKEVEKQKPFKDIYDFIYKLNDFLTPVIFTSLIKSGALDSLENRSTLLKYQEELLNYKEVIKDLGTEYALKPEIKQQKEVTEEEKIEMEKEMLGFYLTNHPIVKIKGELNSKTSILNLPLYFDKHVEFFALVKNVREIETKTKQKMCFVTLEDEEGIIEGVLFPNVYDKVDIKKDSIYQISAHIEKRYDEYQAIIEQIKKVG